MKSNISNGMLGDDGGVLDKMLGSVEIEIESVSVDGLPFILYSI